MSSQLFFVILSDRNSPVTVLGFIPIEDWVYFQSVILSVPWSGNRVVLSDALRAARTMLLYNRPEVQKVVIVLSAAVSIPTDFNTFLAEATSLKSIAR